jgi:hypothetical protein
MVMTASQKTGKVRTLVNGELEIRNGLRTGAGPVAKETF